MGKMLLFLVGKQLITFKYNIKTQTNAVNNQPINDHAYPWQNQATSFRYFYLIK